MNGSKLPHKIIRPLFQSKELSLRLHVVLYDDQNGGCQYEFKFGNKKYVRLDPSVYLTMDIRKENIEYDRSSSVLIGRGNLHIYRKSFKQMLDNIYNEAIFANKGNTIISYQDMVDRFTEKIVIPKLNSVTLLRPAVVYDENEVSYEGVNIFINKNENMASLFIDEFETLVDILMSVDLVLYSQSLINYCVSVYDDITTISQPKQIENQLHQKRLIDWNNTEPKTESNFRKPTNNIFEGLKGSE